MFIHGRVFLFKLVSSDLKHELSIQEIIYYR
jgi:hypothetical protein